MHPNNFLSSQKPPSAIQRAPAIRKQIPHCMQKRGAKEKRVPQAHPVCSLFKPMNTIRKVFYAIIGEPSLAQILCTRKRKKENICCIFVYRIKHSGSIIVIGRKGKAGQYAQSNAISN